MGLSNLLLSGAGSSPPLPTGVPSSTAVLQCINNASYSLLSLCLCFSFRDVDFLFDNKYTEAVSAHSAGCMHACMHVWRGATWSCIFHLRWSCSATEHGAPKRERDYTPLRTQARCLSKAPLMSHLMTKNPRLVQNSVYLEFSLDASGTLTTSM